MRFLSNQTDSASRNFLYSAIFWLVIADTVGLITAFKFFAPDLFPGEPGWLTFGRLRMVHVNGVLFLWLSMAYVGAWLYMIPRMVGTSLYSERLGNLSMWLWNLLGVLAVLTLSLGMNQGREYAELIWPLDILFLVSLGLVGVNVFATVWRRAEPRLYVAVWYIMATILWMSFVYAIGNVIWRPDCGCLAGLDDAILNWFYGHNVLGLWFTTGGLALVYYLVPKITRTPLYGHMLSLIAFWAIALFYTGQGQHHLLQTPTPAWLKTIAISSSIALFVPVFTFTTNILMTMRRNWDKFYSSIPLKFVLMGLFFYIFLCVQGPLQALMSVNVRIHFTQWIVAHAHLALLGTFTFWSMGAIYYIIPQVLKREIYSTSLANWQWWLTFIGFFGFAVSLYIAGLVQGESWKLGIPVWDVLPSLIPYWVVRAFSGTLIVLGGYVQAYNIWMTARAARRKEPPVPAAVGVRA